MEYNAFCQLLPGASSTQTIVLIAFKRGGFPLALITLFIWILPATSFMASLAIAYTQFDLQPVLKTLHLLQPMVIGFIASATYLLYKKAIRNTITLFVFVFASKGLSSVTAEVRPLLPLPVFAFASTIWRPASGFSAGQLKPKKQATRLKAEARSAVSKWVVSTGGRRIWRREDIATWDAARKERNGR